eukprot:4718766-Alexandrium_andersonii.AAC.1
MRVRGHARCLVKPASESASDSSSTCHATGMGGSTMLAARKTGSSSPCRAWLRSTSASANWAPMRCS